MFEPHFSAAAVVIIVINYDCPVFIIFLIVTSNHNNKYKMKRNKSDGIFCSAPCSDRREATRHSSGVKSDEVRLVMTSMWSQDRGGEGSGGLGRE